MTEEEEQQKQNILKKLGEMEVEEDNKGEGAAEGAVSVAKER